jgi:hypothetical protein
VYHSLNDWSFRAARRRFQQRSERRSRSLWHRSGGSGELAHHLNRLRIGEDLRHLGGVLAEAEVLIPVVDDVPDVEPGRRNAAGAPPIPAAERLSAVLKSRAVLEPGGKRFPCASMTSSIRSNPAHARFPPVASTSA